ncbi:MAG: MerC domain-containing protein [Luteibaculaceae bacterium]
MALRLKKFTSKADILGALASGLCLIHCLAVPVLIVLQKASHELAHMHFLDIPFVVLSFIAVFFASKNAHTKWVGKAMWIAWVAFALGIFLEHESPFFFVLGLVASGFLVYLHLFNYHTNKHCSVKH